MKWTDYFSKAPALWPDIACRWPEFVQKVKAKAADETARKGFPHVRLEAWRKTSLKSWQNARVEPAGISNGLNHGNPFSEDAVHIRMVNGIPLTPWQTENGVQFGRLSEAVQHLPGLVETHFGRLQKWSGDVITDFNTAYFSDGLFVYVPAGTGRVRLEWANTIDARKPYMWNGRILVIVEPDNRVEMTGLDFSEGKALSAGTRVVEIFVKENAVFRSYGWQQINDASALITHQFISASENARVDVFNFPLNGGLLREEIWADITGSKARVNLHGFYAPTGRQQTDERIFVAHGAVGSYSHQQYKGLIDGHAKALFNGRILVRPGAQQTNAYQKNDNMLLSDDARAHSQPFLEIYADDVSCSHGSTTGSLDAEALFYMQQRGISHEAARRLLLYGFADEVIGQIPDEDLQIFTRRLVRAKIDGALRPGMDILALNKEQNLSLTE